MGSRSSRRVFTAIRGRDGFTTNPLLVPEGLAVEVLNMELDGSTLGTKRNGHTTITQNNTWPSPETQKAILVNVGADPTVAEIWGLTNNTGAIGDISYLPVNSGSWVTTSASSTNEPNVNPAEAVGVHFNGRFFLAFASSSGRLKVWDPVLSIVRPAGMAQSAAPSVANTGAGAYAATPRWYQQSYRIKDGATVVAEGERSSSVAFTPSGAGAAARITKGTGASNSETHWVLWGSETSADGPFWEIAETAVGTTTYDDSAAPSTYDNGTAAQVAGTFAVPPYARYLLNDGGNRLLLAGDFNNTHLARVWFTAAMGSLGRGDDERVPQTDDFDYFVDLEEDEDGLITGLGGPLNGHPIVFKRRQIWRLVPTGDPEAPYVARVISKSVGCINNRSIAIGVDEAGNPALYFASYDGPYRLSANGLQFLGHDVQDIWNSRNSSVVFGGFYHRQREYWLYMRDSGFVAQRLRFDARLGRPDETGAVRGGWMRDTGTTAISTAMGLVMVPYSPGLITTDTSIARPHVLLEDGTILLCDFGVQDNGSNYQAYTELPQQALAGEGVRVRTGAPMIIGNANSGSPPTITVKQRKNYGEEDRDATVTMAANQRAHKRCEQGGGMADCDAIGFRVGDGSAQNSGNFTLDALVVAWEPQEAVVTI